MMFLPPRESERRYAPRELVPSEWPDLFISLHGRGGCPPCAGFEQVRLSRKLDAINNATWKMAANLGVWSPRRRPRPADFCGPMKPSARGRFRQAFTAAHPRRDGAEQAAISKSSLAHQRHIDASRVQNEQGRKSAMRLMCPTANSIATRESSRRAA